MRKPDRIVHHPRMRSLYLVLSPGGRLRPQPFILGAVVVYLAGAASHWLTTPAVTARAGLWAFAVVEAVLTWLWFVMHAKRLHDAGRNDGLAVAVALLYALSIAFLLILAANFFAGSGGLVGNASATSALELILFLYIIETLEGSIHHDMGSIAIGILTLFAFVPVIVALFFTLWTATRPSVDQP
jgi:uncharacterized membrane protein YhaH (DUF805 family)